MKEVYLVWTGQRDSEEYVAACESADHAAQFLAEQGVDWRPNPYTSEEELRGDDGDKWGVHQVQFVGDGNV